MYKQFFPLALTALVVLPVVAEEPGQKESYLSRSLKSIILCPLSVMGSVMAIGKSYRLAHTTFKPRYVTRDDGTTYFTGYYEPNILRGPMAYALYSSLLSCSLGLGLWGAGKVFQKSKVEKAGKILAAAGLGGFIMSHGTYFAVTDGTDMSLTTGLALCGAAMTAAALLTSSVINRPTEKDSVPSGLQLT